MMSKKKLIGMITIAALLAGLMAMPVMAASRKKIKTVSLKVEASITPETRVGSEDVDVEVKDSAKYSYDTYEVNNSGFEWEATDVPELTIYLRAEDSYYFAVTKLSDVKVDGATLVKASKQDSSETLKVVVKLPSLSEYVADFSEEETVTLTDNGFAVWNPISGAGSYEVMVYRDGNTVGVTARTVAAFCDRIAKDARAGRVPIIRKETASFLQAMVASKQPEHILEVGTAVGYSAILMAQVMPEGTDILTIEKYEPRIPVARRHFEEAGLSDRITLLEGDAGEILKKLEGPFDFIFMDAAKGQYIHWLPDILRLLSANGVLFSDNVLQDGDIIESRFAVERRNRTIHARMREYLYTLTHMSELQTSVVPIGDGVALSVKR